MRSVPDNAITSCGIDIGTTSTHLVIARLILENLALPNQAPRLAVTERDILYQSEIYNTPLTAEGVIDAEKIASIIQGEYERAKVSPSDIETGAAIITGETAKLRNASEVIRELAALAGDFVVASAGPNLESILSAHGSGAVQYSRDTGATVCNIDVGGGTTNIAVYRAGELLDTACLCIGGRCLTVNENWQICSLSEGGQVFVDAVGRCMPQSGTITLEQLERLGQLLGEMTVNFLSDRPPQISRRLLVTDDLRRGYEIDEFWFCGGVGELMRHPVADPLLYFDAGPVLARGLSASLAERKLAVRIPDQAIRATVIGAGGWTTQVSGSTVCFDRRVLPLRDLPVVGPLDIGRGTAFELEETLKRLLQQKDIEWQENACALVLEILPAPRFALIEDAATRLAQVLNGMDMCEPYVLILCQDIAMALGQLLRQLLPGRQFLVLDGLDVQREDFVDIGRPLGSGECLPVVAKSLVFRQG